MAESDPAAPRVGIIGAGRAGRSFAAVLAERGWGVTVLGRAESTPDRLKELATANDFVLICVPDAAITSVVGLFDRASLDSDVVFVHCSGVSGLDVLAPAKRRGSIHPLVSLNGHEPQRLIGAWFALAGDKAVTSIADALDGQTITVEDDSRALYHTASVIASNHVVALMGQVQRISDSLGIPVEAFVELARGSLDSASRLGPEAALTGPVSRGDFDTVAAHLAALRDVGLGDEVGPYVAMAKRAAVLAGRDPDAIDLLRDDLPPDAPTPPTAGWGR